MLVYCIKDKLIRHFTKSSNTHILSLGPAASLPAIRSSSTSPEPRNYSRRPHNTQKKHQFSAHSSRLRSFSSQKLKTTDVFSECYYLYTPHAYLLTLMLEAPRNY